MLWHGLCNIKFRHSKNKSGEYESELICSVCYRFCLFKMLIKLTKNVRLNSEGSYYDLPWVNRWIDYFLLLFKRFLQILQGQTLRWKKKKKKKKPWDVGLGQGDEGIDVMQELVNLTVNQSCLDWGMLFAQDIISKAHSKYKLEYQHQHFKCVP